MQFIMHSTVQTGIVSSVMLLVLVQVSHFFDDKKSKTSPRLSRTFQNCYEKFFSVFFRDPRMFIYIEKTPNYLQYAKYSPLQILE